MRLRGGYNILPAGRPSDEVQVLPEPETLYLPLRSRRFSFSRVCVQENQRVEMGDVLARDPENYSIPLLGPRGGVIRLKSLENHIVLEDVVHTADDRPEPLERTLNLPEEVKERGPRSVNCFKLLELGAWQYFYDAHTQALPNPLETPRTAIVSTVRLEPFGTRGDTQLRKHLPEFARGLKHIQTLLDHQPIYLILPRIDSDLTERIRRTIRGYTGVNLFEVPLRYPFDNFTVLVRTLGLNKAPGAPVWALRTEGVLAVERALTLSKPCTAKIISLGGPAVISPSHLKAIPGYPLGRILSGRVHKGPVRVIDGGVMTGETVNDGQVGLQSECSGLTVLEESTSREVLGFARPGLDRRSYSNCFLSSLRKALRERLTTAVRGERRACVGCGFCEEVCPVRIMPHLIHKLFYQYELEQIELARVDLCITCGLCAYVCPSKIDLRKEILEAQEAIRRDLHPETEGVRV